jgi:glycerol-3-phosphate dehydrogenase
VPEDSYARLASRYGYAAHDVLRIARERGALAQPILPGHPDLLAEVAFAARREQAATLGDVLLRRTRMALVDARALIGNGDGALERAGAVLGAELAWGAERQAAEVAAFRAEADAEGVLPAA